MQEKLQQIADLVSDLIIELGIMRVGLSNYKGNDAAIARIDRNHNRLCKSMMELDGIEISDNVIFRTKKDAKSPN